MNGEIVIPTERPVSLDVAEGIALFAEQDCQNEANSDRGIWWSDATLLFRSGQAVRHFKILPSLTLREFTPDSNGKFTSKFNTFCIGPLVRMTESKFTSYFRTFPIGPLVRMTESKFTSYFRTFPIGPLVRMTQSKVTNKFRTMLTGSLVRITGGLWFQKNRHAMLSQFPNPLIAAGLLSFLKRGT